MFHPGSQEPNIEIFIIRSCITCHFTFSPCDIFFYFILVFDLKDCLLMVGNCKMSRMLTKQCLHKKASAGQAQIYHNYRPIIFDLAFLLFYSMTQIGLLVHTRLFQNLVIISQFYQNQCRRGRSGHTNISEEAVIS